MVLEYLIPIMFVAAIWVVVWQSKSKQQKEKTIAEAEGRYLLRETLHSTESRTRPDYDSSAKGSMPTPLIIDKETHLMGRETCFVAVVDTESTGLEKTDEPVSLGIILYEVEINKGSKLAEIGRYYGEREPNVPIHPRAAAVNGMTIARLKGKKLDNEVIHTLLSQADIIVAHNANFDYRMVWQVYPEAASKIWACSIQSLKFHWSSFPNRKLDTLCEAFNIQRAQPHNALSDCDALAQLLFTRTGKTERSSTYMGALVRRPWISRR